MSVDYIVCLKFWMHFEVNSVEKKTNNLQLVQFIGL